MVSGTATSARTSSLSATRAIPEAKLGLQGRSQSNDVMFREPNSCQAIADIPRPVPTQQTRAVDIIERLDVAAATRTPMRIYRWVAKEHLRPLTPSTPKIRREASTNLAASFHHLHDRDTTTKNSLPSKAFQRTFCCCKSVHMLLGIHHS